MAENEMDLGAVLEKLLSNGDAAQMIEKLKASVENIGAIPETESKNELPTSPIDTSQLAEKLPQMVSAIAPLMEKGSFSKVGEKASVGNRNALLSALRPYLKTERREMIDKIMTLSRLTGIMDMLPRDK